MADGKIKTLYSDKEKTEALFPRTKVNAISDNNGRGLDAILESTPFYSNEDSSDVTTVPMNADTLGGVPASDYATQSFVTNKIAEAQLSSGGNIDLSGYATKDDLNKIDFPVDSVNGKTGVVTLSASDIGAAPDGYGLGDKDHAPVVGDWGTLNAMVQPGWYKVAFTTWLTGEHLLRVDAAHDLIVQTFIWQDGNGIISGRRCKMSSSDWTELEWIGDIDGGTW